MPCLDAFDLEETSRTRVAVLTPHRCGCPQAAFLEKVEKISASDLIIQMGIAIE
jgi:hypothetical protein